MSGHGGPRVVAFGGGTGMPVLLAGLRERADVGVTAVVTVADDGGSSGRLRDMLGVAPPGDIRNCLVALAGDRRLADAFGHRFSAGGDLEGHALGNLVLAGLAATEGDLCEAVELAGRMLHARGTVLPAATEGLTLVARAADGTEVHGESSAASLGAPIAAVEAAAPGAAAPLAVREAIAAADAVVLGPGSLFTSTIAALLGAGTREQLRSFGGPVVYVANVMTQPGETTGLDLAGHLEAIARHGGPRVTDAVVAADDLPAAVLERYRAEGAEPVVVDEAACERLGARLHRAPLLAGAQEARVRHDPRRLAGAVLAAAGLLSPAGR